MPGKDAVGLSTRGEHVSVSDATEMSVRPPENKDPSAKEIINGIRTGHDDTQARLRSVIYKEIL